jgi:predicted AlkP superfamily pyrophosphatase or phosphodiesterase
MDAGDDAMSRPRKAHRAWAIGVAVLMLTTACSTSSDPEGSAVTRDLKPMPSRLRTWFPEPSEDVTRPISDWLEAACELDEEQLVRILRGHYPERSYDIYFIPRAPNFIGTFDYTTHGGPWDYLQRVPLVFYGPGFIREQGTISVDREITVADVAPTLASLLGIPWDPGRAGRPITEALLPPRERDGQPKLIVTVVWDGGGSDVLRAWPRAWPHLRRLMHGGTSVARASVGSAPSTTPPVHTTLGTGEFPNHHGITDLTMRTGSHVLDSFSTRTRTLTPENMQLETLADIYDRRVANRAVIGLLGHRGWHLGMMGQGAYAPGGDKDIAAIVERGQDRIVTNRDYYSLPTYVNAVGGFLKDLRVADLTDGKRDMKWSGHVSLTDPVTREYTPAWTLYQTRLAKKLLEEEQFGADETSDLFFVNYKQIDDVGHFYNMLSDEMQEILRFTDGALEDLTNYLDERVGRHEWVMVMTADHGETPAAEATGGWPISSGLLATKLANHFGVGTSQLILRRRTMGFWLNGQTMAQAGFDTEDVADYLMTLTVRDLAPTGEAVPDAYTHRLEETVFSAAFPGDRVDALKGCLSRR